MTAPVLLCRWCGQVLTMHEPTGLYSASGDIITGACQQNPLTGNRPEVGRHSPDAGAAARLAAHNDPSLPAVRELASDTRLHRSIDFLVAPGRVYYTDGHGPFPGRSGIARYERWHGGPWSASEVVIVGPEREHLRGEWRGADLAPDATWSTCPAWLRGVVEYLRPKDADPEATAELRRGLRFLDAVAADDPRFARVARAMRAALSHDPTRLEPADHE